jgi:hypothetical protein
MTTTVSDPATLPDTPAVRSDLGFVRRMRRARRWVRFADGRWQPIPPRVDWFVGSVLSCSWCWSTFRSAARAAADPNTCLLGVVIGGRIVPIHPDVVLAVATVQSVRVA